MIGEWSRKISNQICENQDVYKRQCDSSCSVPDIQMQKRMDHSSDRPDNILLSVSYALLHQESVFAYTRCAGR